MHARARATPDDVSEARRASRASNACLRPCLMPRTLHTRRARRDATAEAAKAEGSAVATATARSAEPEGSAEVGSAEAATAEATAEAATVEAATVEGVSCSRG